MSKRVETGRKLGREWKEVGHAAEFMFNAKFFKRDKLNFDGPSADCLVNDKTFESLRTLGVEGREVSLKAGSTAQFHLGVIDELSNKEHYKRTLATRMVRGRPATCGKHHLSWEDQLEVLRSKSFWRKYLGKGDFYCQLEKDGKSYTFFSMEHVISFIVENAQWRLLETGRIKGDLPAAGKKGGFRLRPVITFEFRPEKGLFVLGANGGQSGYLFCDILKQQIDSVTLK